MTPGNLAKGHSRTKQQAPLDQLYTYNMVKLQIRNQFGIPGLLLLRSVNFFKAFACCSFISFLSFSDSSCFSLGQMSGKVNDSVLG